MVKVKLSFCEGGFLTSEENLSFVAAEFLEVGGEPMAVTEEGGKEGEGRFGGKVGLGVVCIAVVTAG